MSTEKPKRKKRKPSDYIQQKRKKAAELKARWQAQKTKPFEVSLREHIGKAIDRIDPLEAMATLALTPVVKNAIDTVPALVSWWETIQAAGTPFVYILWKQILGWTTPTTVTEEIEKYPEWMKWLVAFGLAYVLVHHAGQLLGLLDKGIGQVLTMLVGA